MSLHQARIDLPRAAERLLDGVFGDLVKHQPVDRHFGLEQLEQVPGDRFTLAIFVRRQVQVIRFLQRRLELADLFLFVIGNNVNRLKVLVDVDGQIRPRLTLILLGHIGPVARQIADVSDARFDLISAAEKF